MILQALFLAIPFVIAGTIGFIVLIRNLAARISAVGKILSPELLFVLDKSTVYDNLIAFLIQISIVFSFILSLLGVSNHLIISLDIIYFSSILLLVFLHIRKEAAYLPGR